MLVEVLTTTRKITTREALGLRWRLTSSVIRLLFPVITTVLFRAMELLRVVLPVTALRPSSAILPMVTMLYQLRISPQGLFPASWCSWLILSLVAQAVVTSKITAPLQAVDNCCSHREGTAFCSPLLFSLRKR